MFLLIRHDETFILITQAIAIECNGNRIKILQKFFQVDDKNAIHGGRGRVEFDKLT
jgi:hypothetical protein